MPFDAKCPECDAEFRLLDRDRGKRFRCENCSHDFMPSETKEDGRPRRTSPAGRDEGKERSGGGYWNDKRSGDGARKAARDDEEDRKPAGSRRRSREPSGGGDNSGVYIAVGVAAFLVLAAAGLCIWIFTQESEPEPAVQAGPFAGGPNNNNNPWPGPAQNHNPPPQQQQLKDLDSDTLLARLDPNSGVAPWDRQAALDELAKRKEPRAIAPAARLLNSFFDRTNAQNALRSFGPAALPQVLGYFNHADHGTRGAARSLISEWRTGVALLLAQSLEDLKSADANQRRASLDWLAQVKPDEAKRAEAAKALGPLLSERDRWTQDAAFKAMKVWAHKDAVPDLIAVLESNASQRGHSQRSQAIEILAELKDERAAAPIARRVPFLQDRAAASKALKALGSAAEEDVAKLLSHSDSFTRMEACAILEVIGTEKSLPKLGKLAQSNKFDISSGRAKSAMESIQKRVNSP